MKNIAIILAVISLFLFAGCSTSISKIKDPSYEGKTVTVSGTVENTVKIGQLSGYTLVDSNGDKIAVSTDNLPTEGSKVTVKGTLIKDSLFGYYIKN